MCGISALIGRNKLGLNNDVQKMTDLIAHRGPDGSGIYCDGVVGLGHRRLSIVDLSSAGAQPMHYMNRYVITYNGEVYNHHELRSELQNLGYVFESKSDTEVILAAYAVWGAECLNKFNGMWAFVIYDKEAQTIFAARDRFGVKPLYYWFNSKAEQFAFVSEIKQLTVLDGWEAVANPQRCFDFLRYGMLDHTCETMFADVFQVRGGHAVFAKISDFDFDKKTFPNPYQWYDLKSNIRPSSVENSDRIFRTLLEESVALRLRADVPVGSCLSGGLDSSSIVCVMNEQLKKSGAQGKQVAFSACSTIERFDERKYIDQVVEATGVQAHYTYPDFGELFDVLSKLVWHQDEPFGSTSVFAQWKVFELASAEKVKVMLDGQGADEQLLGYHSFFGLRWAELLKKGQIFSLYQEFEAAKRIHKYSLKSFVKKMAYYFLPSGFAVWLAYRLGGQKNWEWLNTQKLGLSKAQSLRASFDPSSVDEMSLMQMLQTSVPMLLHWEDRDSMAHGVESRVPFLDYRLVEYVMGLPTDQKLKNGETKVVLRRAMKDILPKSIGGRMDKMGFVTPEEYWVREVATDEFRAALVRAIDNSNGIVSSLILDRLDGVLNGHIAFDYSFWRVISFGAWISTFKVKVKTID